jgi:hypothetical protein
LNPAYTTLNSAEYSSRFYADPLAQDGRSAPLSIIQLAKLFEEGELDGLTLLFGQVLQCFAFCFAMNDQYFHKIFIAKYSPPVGCHHLGNRYLIFQP